VAIVFISEIEGHVSAREDKGREASINRTRYFLNMVYSPVC
jgi:hypothetical protein